MALVPVSMLFEVFFAVISILLLERPFNLSKIVAIGMWLFVINLVFLPQEFYTDASGTLAETTIAFPTAINGFVVFGLVIVLIYEIYNAYAFSQGKREW
jgi:hypothetical protein